MEGEREGSKIGLHKNSDRELEVTDSSGRTILLYLDLVSNIKAIYTDQHSSSLDLLGGRGGRYEMMWDKRVDLL